jgi:hypothetical protein
MLITFVITLIFLAASVGDAARHRSCSATGKPSFHPLGVSLLLVTSVSATVLLTLTTGLFFVFAFVSAFVAVVVLVNVLARLLWALESAFAH